MSGLVVLLRWNQQEVQGLLSPLLCRFVKQMLNKSLVAFPIMIYHCASASSHDSQHGQVVKKTQCRLGYTESHTAAPGFGPGEVTEGPFIFVSCFVFTLQLLFVIMLLQERYFHLHTTFVKIKQAKNVATGMAQTPGIIC